MATVMIVGGGGREHALAHTLRNSACKPEIVVAPGNAGTDKIATNVAIDASDVDSLVSCATSRRVDLVVVGPEAPLVAGLADRLRDCRIPVVGPNRAAAALEGSKAFAKSVMVDGGIPTAVAATFDDPVAAKRFAAGLSGKVAVKADGLASGKGVIVTDEQRSAEAAIDELGTKYGRLVVEEKLEGEELSVIALTDGAHLVTMAPSQDHKRVGDGDTGPNTGGMGAYAPAPRGTADLMADVRTRCLEPVLRVMQDRGAPFSGVLYAGLMLTADGPKVLEYNVRFGDPETQVILPLLDEDPYELFLAVATGGLSTRPARLRAQSALTVVLASEGYPKSPRLGDVIEGVDAARDGVIVFHAGTKRGDDGAVLTAGGRVLTVTGLGDNLPSAAARAYEAVQTIRWPGMHYRRDIGRRALDVEIR